MKELDQAIAALEFYADGTNYLTGECPASEIDFDLGQIAQEALQAITEYKARLESKSLVDEAIDKGYDDFHKYRRGAHTQQLTASNSVEYWIVRAAIEIIKGKDNA